jgi:predicted nucleic acid-binding protein
MLVSVDASVAAAWRLPDEASETADQLIVQAHSGFVSLQAPGLWRREAGTVLRMATVRKRASRSHGSSAMPCLSL